MFQFFSSSGRKRDSLDGQSEEIALSLSPPSFKLLLLTLDDCRATTFFYFFYLYPSPRPPFRSVRLLDLGLARAVPLTDMAAYRAAQGGSRPSNSSNGQPQQQLVRAHDEGLGREVKKEREKQGAILFANMSLFRSLRLHDSIRISPPLVSSPILFIACSRLQYFSFHAFLNYLLL